METKTILFIVWGIPAFFCGLFSLGAPMLTIFACASMGNQRTAATELRSSVYKLTAIYNSTLFQFGTIFPALHFLSLGYTGLAWGIVLTPYVGFAIFCIIHRITDRENIAACKEHDLHMQALRKAHERFEKRKDEQDKPSASE